MVWMWRYSDADGEPVATVAGGPLSESFASQSDAETWLGTAWTELLDAGVAQVSLLDDERLEYTMPLTPADS